MHSSATNSSSVLDVLHIAGDDLHHFGSLAVTLNQIYGSRSTDKLPFGSSSSGAIQFDGRIRSSPILSFLPEAIETPSKKVRVYELSPLAASDKRSYDELVAFFSKHERCPVVDKEYNMGILLYFVPPKLIFKKVEPSNQEQKDKKKRSRKHQKDANRINLVDALGLHGMSGMREDRVWLISITSTTKYLLFKQKRAGNKERAAAAATKKKSKTAHHDRDELSDFDISDSDGSEHSASGSEEPSPADSEDDVGMKQKVDIEKSELIVALEGLYKAIGQKLPDPL